jgi:hypothetical protein
MSRLLRCQRITLALSVLPLVALTSLLLVAAPLDITRTWKSSDGVYSVDAELVEAKDGKVSLRKRNGVVIEVPLARLSAEDQAYVAKYMEAGSFSRYVNTASGQATAPTWADQEPDPTYDDPEEQAIMLSRKRDPTRRLLDTYYRIKAEQDIQDLRERKSAAIGQKNLPTWADREPDPTYDDPEELSRKRKTLAQVMDDYYRIQAEGDIQDLRERKSAAIGQKNLESRNRGIDTLQASSAMGDTGGAEERSRKYQEEMRQASENPRLAPTFGRMFDDPIGWLSATTGEYALLALFCGSIFAGVFFWISKQRSRHETQRNSEGGGARLVGKETFFWVREFQDYKVVYTYRNYKLFYFCILPLLIALMVVPVIGWIPILAWIFYWGIYPCPNKEISQLLREAQCVATGSKFSSVNPMRLTVSRTDFDRIVLGTECTTPETARSSTAPALPSAHSDSSSSDAELESLKKKNEELKRKVEAKKLAEKQAKDKAALEAENARLMAELGEET